MTITLDEAIRQATSELREKSLEQIEEETAITWAGRAIAAYRRFEPNSPSARYWRRLAYEFMHEAIEHAASAAEGGELVRALRRQLAFILDL